MWPRARAAVPATLVAVRRIASRRQSVVIAVGPTLFYAALAVAVTAPPALAQRGHPMPRGPRALHVRLAEADVVAFGTVAGLQPGRMQVRDAAVLAGDAEPGFPVKRAPSEPVELEPGDRVLLLLRGARPPYILAGRPDERVVIPDDAAEARWRAAVERTQAAAPDLYALRALYLQWLDGPAEDLRRLAAQSLLDADVAYGPLPADRAETRARVALDPGAPQTTRQVSAMLAVRSEPGLDALLAGLAAPDTAADTTVIQTALRAGALRRRPRAARAALRALRHAEPKVRNTAVPFARVLAAAVPELRPELEHALARATEDGEGRDEGAPSAAKSRP